MPKNVVKETIKTDYATLQKNLANYNKELLQLRTYKVMGVQNNRMGKIRKLRKSIAQTLTLIRAKQILDAKENYSSCKSLPIALRTKTTRAMRRRLTPEQANRKTVKEQKKATNLPRRRYYIKSLDASNE